MDRWCNSPKGIKILSTLTLSFLKCHNFNINGFCCSCNNGMLFVYLSGISRIGSFFFFLSPVVALIIQKQHFKIRKETAVMTSP